MCGKALLENGRTLKSVLTAIKVKNCVIRQLIITLMR